uniref:Uncharacterized protein n=1 Tax=Daphnia galeata TaxID=27404 RepID=A0A8J2S174_9CRUS|nr:unnamed protein product [Daphnia galeata]
MGDFDGDKEAFKVEMSMFILQPKSLENCKVVFQLGSSIQLDETTGTSFSNITTTSEYELMNVVKAASVTNHINLLRPDAFISPAKTNMESSFEKLSIVTSPGTVCPSPPAPTLPSVSADLNGSFQELFKEPLFVEALPAQAGFPSILRPFNVQQQPKEHAAREIDAGNPIQFQMMTIH